MFITPVVSNEPKFWNACRAINIWPLRRQDHRPNHPHIARQAATSSLLQNHFRNRMFCCMRNRKMRGGGARLFIEFPRATVKQNHRRARLFRRHFDVLPTDASTPTGLQSFQRRFFCCEARGIMLGGHYPVRFTTVALRLNEHALSDPLPPLTVSPHASN